MQLFAPFGENRKHPDNVAMAAKVRAVSAFLSKQGRGNCNQGLDIADPEEGAGKGAELWPQTFNIHTSLVLKLQTNSLIPYAVGGWI